MQFLSIALMVVLCCHCGYLVSGACCGTGSGNGPAMDQENRIVTAVGYRAAVDNQTNVADTITVPGALVNEIQCLERCRFTDKRCIWVSYDYSTQSCLGFSRTALPAISRDINAVIVTQTRKRTAQMRDPLVFNYNAKDYIQTGVGGKIYIETVGSVDGCKQLCTVHPLCNYGSHVIVQHYILIIFVPQQSCVLKTNTDMKGDVGAGYMNSFYTY